MVSEEVFRNLPPQTRQRLNRILIEHVAAILTGRASVVRERRGNGYPFFRLYIESGSGHARRRQRVYVGSQGGPELRAAIKELRRVFWGPQGDAAAFLRAAWGQLGRGVKEARKSARGARDAVLSQVGRRMHGRSVRSRRDVPAVERYRAEYRTLSRALLEQETWPGITEEEYVGLRSRG